MVNIIFFGSFQHYSALILQSLIDRSLNHEIEVTGVITTPPTPMGRKKILTKNPTHLLAEKHNIPVFTPSSLSASSPDSLIARSPDLFITAGYGKILPKEWLEYPKLGCLNLHFSLLPRYRGANPAEWAIMCSETETGITLMEMNEGLDKGAIMQQASLPITDIDTRETLYEKLYQLGASLLPAWLSDVQDFAERSRTPLAGVEHRKNSVGVQPEKSPSPYAALLKRNDGFIPWTTIQKYLQKKPLTLTDFPSTHLQKALEYAESCRSVFLTTQGSEGSRVESKIYDERRGFLMRLPRALSGFPSLWTVVKTNKGEKRMKILSFSPFLVHLEGRQPTSFNQIKNTLQ